MRFRLLRPRELARMVRETARRRPDTAEEYLDSHPEEWESIAEADPHDAADILEALEPEGAVDLLRELEVDQAVEVIEEMHRGPATELLAEVSTEEAARLVAGLDPDVAADVLGDFDEELRLQILTKLEPETASEIRALLKYPPDSAGGIMTTDFAVLPVGMAAGEAIEALRRLSGELDDLSYVYVVDEDYRLQGVLSFRELVFARPGTGLETVMVSNPVIVQPETDREVVAELIQRYRLFALPVVQMDGKLVGIVRVDEAIEAIQEEASEDLAVTVGAGVDEDVFTPVRRSVQMRLPWILVNLALAAIVAATISRFESTIDELSVLAALMPVVALVGGNGGAQSLAVVIRSMAVQQVPAHRARPVIAREVNIALLNGVVLAFLSGSIALVLSGELRVAGVMALAALANMLIGGLAGASIPLILRRLGYDPALASNIFLTFITDMVGFGGFLVIATLLL